MSLVRIAVASTPLTATLAEAVPAAVDAIRAAGDAGASIVCLPETAIPGHRCQPRPVEDVDLAAMVAAISAAAQACGESGIAAVIGAERPTPRGREIAAVVIDAGGAIIGWQPKTQLDPSEEPHYVAGAGRRVFDLGGLRFGVATCHEAFRYPEISRSLALAGAQVVFVPHFVGTDDGSLPPHWLAPGSPYNEQAIRCRALENSVFVAAANIAGPDQGSITGVIGPEGSLEASLPYGRIGVATADLDLLRADARMARRWAPERNEIG